MGGERKIQIEEAKQRNREVKGSKSDRDLWKETGRCGAGVGGGRQQCTDKIQKKRETEIVKKDTG